MTKVLRFPGFATARHARTRFYERMAKGRTALSAPSCDGCFFKCHGLCSIAGSETCATFRPNHADGLRPPRQLQFNFRQERRQKVAWAFPSAAEQAALHN